MDQDSNIGNPMNAGQVRVRLLAKTRMASTPRPQWPAGRGSWSLPLSLSKLVPIVVPTCYFLSRFCWEIQTRQSSRLTLVVKATYYFSSLKTTFVYHTHSCFLSALLLPCCAGINLELGTTQLQCSCDVLVAPTKIIAWKLCKIDLRFEGKNR